MTEIHYASKGAEPGSPRRAMIDSQLRPSGVNEPWALSAIAAVAREDFVPEQARAAAYSDRAVPLGNGRYLPAPLYHGKAVATAEPRKTDKVLVVTVGSDYLPALLRSLVASVDTVDAGDLAKGLPGSGYSLIVVDGAAEEIPAVLIDALSADGRLVTGMINKTVTRIALGRKSGSALSYLPLLEMGIPAIPELAAPKRWSF
jgi:protein-L-isoaspartate(D-aspartate) O-methyltransferase